MISYRSWFSGGACGIPTYDHYFGFTKSNQLVHLPDIENVSDAGVFQQHIPIK